MIYFQPVYVDENQNRVYGFNDQLMTTYQQDLVEKYIERYASSIDTKNIVPILIQIVKQPMNLF